MEVGRKTREVEAQLHRINFGADLLMTVSKPVLGPEVRLAGLRPARDAR